MNFTIIFTIIISIFIISIIINKLNKPSYQYTSRDLPSTFNKFYKKKLKISEERNVRPGNEEKLIKYSNRKTQYAILYIHGYGTCRAEGEFVVDKIAKKFKANTFYLRLPGHGTNKEDHLETEFDELLDEALETLFMMEKLGKKLILIGCSMGGLLATYAAAKFPEKIDAIILASPFYNFALPTPRLLYYKPMHKLTYLLKSQRKLGITEEEIKQGKDWSKFWYTEQYIASIKLVVDLSKFIAKPKILKKITIPILMLYYYKDKNNQDKTASVKHMLEAYDHFGKESVPHELNNKVQIENGHHVLMSKFWVDDKKKMISEISKFIKKI